MLKTRPPGEVRARDWSKGTLGLDSRTINQRLRVIVWFYERMRCAKMCKTPVIPREALRTLFIYAEDILKRADALLDERDAGRRSIDRDPEITLIRDACFFLLGLLTGMRCEEIVGVEVGAGRTEVKDSVSYHWVKSIEHKTKKGRVEYLMPSMGREVLRVMERWSEPPRVWLKQILAAGQAETGGNPRERLRRIAAARSDASRLFLGVSSYGIAAVPGTTWGRN